MRTSVSAAEVARTWSRIAFSAVIATLLTGLSSSAQSPADQAQLAGRFAELTRDALAGYGGTLLELRGDEALCVFPSARRAIRAAIDLQRRFRERVDGEPVISLGVGMGLDAGEAVPTEGGYRGGALNLAARLCSMGQAGNRRSQWSRPTSTMGVTVSGAP